MLPPNGTLSARHFPKAKMSRVLVEKEILDLENRYWPTIQEKNVNEMVLLTDFPCLVTGAMGAGSID